MGSRSYIDQLTLGLGPSQVNAIPRGSGSVEWVLTKLYPPSAGPPVAPPPTSGDRYFDTAQERWFFYDGTNLVWVPLPDKDVADALTGSFGVPSAANKYLTEDDASVAQAVNRIPRADALGFLEPEWVAQAQVVTVALSGSADFNSIKAAVDSIVDASEAKPYKVKVAAGVFVEDPFTIPGFVSVEGEGIFNTQIETSNNNAHFITASPGGMIRQCAIKGPVGVGFATINYDAAGFTPFHIHFVVIRAGYYGIWCHPAASRGIIHAFFVGNWYAGLASQNFMRATDFGNITAMNCAWMNGAPGAVVQGFYVSGPNAEITLDYCSFRQTGATDAVFVDDGSQARLAGTVFSRSLNAIHIGSLGNNSRVYASGCVMRRGGTITGQHILIDAGLNPVLEYSGTLDKNLVTDNGIGTVLAIVASDLTPGEAGSVVFGELWLGTQAEAVPLGAWVRESASTGWVSGGEVTRGVGLDLDVAPGVGFVNTGTGVIEVFWVADTVSATANATNWVYIDSSSTVQISTTFPGEETKILLAQARAGAAGILWLAKVPVDMKSPVVGIHEWIEAAVGNLWETGITATQHGVDPSLQIAVSAGRYFQAALPLNTTGAAPITFTYWYQDGVGGWTAVVGQTAIDDDFYDDGSGVLAAIPAGEWKKDNLWVVEGGDGTEYHVVYAQETHPDQPSAEAGGKPNPPPWFDYSGIPTWGPVVQKASGDIASLVDERPSVGGTGSGSTATNDHGLLSGLSDDDHLQYMLLTGNAARNALTGTISAIGGVILLPQSAAPAQTAEGSVVWDTNDDRLTVGDGAGRKLLMNQGDAAGGDVGGTFPTGLTVSDLTIAGEVQGSVLYFNGANWVRLPPGVAGQFLQTAGGGANPLWAASGGKLAQTASSLVTTDISTSSATYSTATGLSLTMTVGANSRLIIMAYLAGMGNSTQNMRVQVDGVTVGTASGIHGHAGSDNQWGMSIVQRTAPLAAGLRTVTIQWRATAGTAVVNANTAPLSDGGSLIVMEVLP